MLSVSAGLVGCRAAAEGFDAPSPSKRLDAIVAANAEGDRSAIVDLIRQLDSTDPAARMLAIRTLESWTGETMGYDHADPDHEREPSIQRWVDWYNGQADEAEQMAMRPDAGEARGGTVR